MKTKDFNDLTKLSVITEILPDSDKISSISSPYYQETNIMFQGQTRNSNNFLPWFVTIFPD
jgi:hypothetical protein